MWLKPWETKFWKWAIPAFQIIIDSMKTSSNHGKLWKNQRIIDEHGLVVCEERERLFENAECAYLLEDMLMVCQRKNNLPIHYMRYSMNGQEENQTITYPAYVGYRCVKRERVEGKHRVIGELNIIYKITRLDPQRINCRFPFLLLFDIKCGEVTCQECEQPHICRITESSFYVIQTMFMQELQKKIAFMQKYPNYTFTPHSYKSTRNAGEAIYEHIKDHNYEPSYYVERCQTVLVNALKMEMIKRGIDAEVDRFDVVAELLEGKVLNSSLRRVPLYKLKYMCRKCEPREIWTTKDKVPIEAFIVSLQGLFPELAEKYFTTGHKKIIEGSELMKKYLSKFEEDSQSSSKNIVPSQKTQESEEAEKEEKLLLHEMYKTEQRRLDRSIRKEVTEYEAFEGEIKPYGTWHNQQESYQYPFIVLLKLTVPKMNCMRCHKEKDGLIYITNLIDSAHSYLNQMVISKLEEVGTKGKKKKKNKENRVMN